MIPSWNWNLEETALSVVYFDYDASHVRLILSHGSRCNRMFILILLTKQAARLARVLPVSVLVHIYLSLGIREPNLGPFFKRAEL